MNGWRNRLQRLLRPATPGGITERARAGEPGTCFALAEAYLAGDGVPRSLPEALRWLSRAAAAGHAGAMTRLAALALQGIVASDDSTDDLFADAAPGAAPRPDIAARLAAEAAETGHAPAQALLGMLLATGQGVRHDPEAAEDWYRRALAAGEDARAALGLGLLQLSQPDIAAAPEGAALVQQAARAGLPVAAYVLGLLQESGIGLAQDPTAAAAQYRVAAMAGLRPAQARLGFALLEGRGVPRNAVEGETWLRRAALAGDAEAATLLGDLHARGGDGLPPNHADAAGWYRRAAEAGHAGALQALGLLHLTGAGVACDPAEAMRLLAAAGEAHAAPAPCGDPGSRQDGDMADPAQALTLYRRAAEAGHVGAMFAAGAYLAGGHGLPPDRVEAAGWFRRAAEAGHPRAQLMLGRFLLRGYVPEHRDGEWAHWLEAAARAGLAEAVRDLAALAHQADAGAPEGKAPR